MPRRLTALLVTFVLGFAGFAPVAAEVSTGMSGHACCQLLTTGATTHEGCSRPARISCCGPASDRSSTPQVPPASTSSSHGPELTLLKGHTGHVPATPVLVTCAAASAFEAARLKLPRDPLYLRHLVLLV